MALERSTARAVEPWPWPEEDSKLQGGALAASLALVILQQLPRVARTHGARTQLLRRAGAGGRGDSQSQLGEPGPGTDSETDRL